MPYFVVAQAILSHAVQRIARKEPLAFATHLHGDPEAATWDGRLLTQYQTLLIMRAALIEFAAFFAILAFMLEGRPLALGVASALLALLLLHVPSRTRVEEWLRVQRDEIRRIKTGVSVG